MKKKHVKRIVTILCILLILPILLFCAIILFLPISLPNEYVRIYVQSRIPIGTSFENAVNSIEKNKWEIKRINSEYGLRINDAAGNVSFATQEDITDLSNDNVRIVGTKAIFVKLGEYNAPFNTVVLAYLAFDEKGELIEIAIQREIDAP